MKKICFILMVLMIIIFMVSCSSDSANNTDNTNNEDSANNTDDSAQDSQNGDAVTENTTENPRFAIKEEIPEVDFNGIDYKIIYPLWSMYIDYYFAEEEIGDKLHDAVYRRTKNAEERLNIKIIPVTDTYDTYHTNVSKSVKSGSDDYQMILTHCIQGITALTTQGLAQDWNKIPVVDFSKPWWNQRMNQTMSIDKILLTAVSDFMIFDPNVIYFNKQLGKDLDLGDIYQIVRDGKWTWSKLTELAKSASKDLNGDGVFDTEDQYGFITNLQWMMNGTVQSCDMYFTKIGDEGYPVNNLNTERFGNMMNMLYELLYVGNQSFVSTWDPNSVTGNESEIPMSSGRVLFHVDPLSAGKRYRTYDVEFGILPFPKYDEAQKEYLSLSWNGFMIIPATADPELAGVVSEVLAAESHRLTVPAYYDVLLTSKLARDEESTEMIDILYKGAVYDYGLNFGDWEAISFAVDRILLTKKTPDYVSFMEKNENVFNKKMKSTYDKIVEIYGS